MRRQEINVVAHRPSPNNDDGYHLLRAFRSDAERVTLSQSVYATEEWEAMYDALVTAMIADCRTTLISTTTDMVERLKR
jgi:hypothetical protein